MGLEAEEYELQYYGFPLKELILQNQMFVHNKIEGWFEMFTEKLIKRLPDAKASEETIQAITNCGKLTAKNIYDSSKEYLADFELLVDKYFHIPNNVILPEDSNHEDENNFNEYVEANLRNEVENMEKTYLENCYILNAMEAEIQMYKTLETIIDKNKLVANQVQETLDSLNETFGNLDGIIDNIKLE